MFSKGISCIRSLSTVGSEVKFSLVNTDEKQLFKTSALPPSLRVASLAYTLFSSLNDVPSIVTAFEQASHFNNKA